MDPCQGTFNGVVGKPQFLINTNDDWKAGVHTPPLGAVKFTILNMMLNTFVIGVWPRQYNKFPIQRRYPVGLPRGSSFLMILWYNLREKEIPAYGAF